MFKQKKMTRIASFILCITLAVCLCVPCFAAPNAKTLVRVGYMQMQGFLYTNEDGTYGGLAYDLLQEIANYNNWEYTFTQCSYAEAEQLFREDKIDIFVPYQRTAERELVYEYSTEVFCTNHASLLTLPNAAIYYGDYAAMDGCTIGVVQNTRNGERFVQYLAKQGCHITLKNDYARQSELIEAAKNGEIDAFISASNRGITDCKIVCVLPATESYVIAPKGNRTYLDPLDSALQKINLEMPTLMESLDARYQQGDEGSFPPLTREETTYIQEKQQVRVLISEVECDENGNFANSAKVIFNDLHELTGLTFVPVVKNSATTVMQAITNGEADIVYAFDRDFAWGDMHNVWLTRDYFSFYNKLVKKNNQSEIHTVGVVPDSYIAYYVANHTDYEMKEYTSNAACMDAVLKGEVDATYCNPSIGNYYATFPKYTTLSFLNAFDFESSYCMAVSYSSDPILIDILNKALLCISGPTLNSTYEVQTNARPVTFSDLVYAHPIGTILLFTVVAAVLLTLVFVLIYSANIHKKNGELAAANRTKTDFMSRMSHDMRTPMNGILGLTQLSKDETDPAVIRANLDQIELSGKFLLDLINDTLDMNKMESGNLKLHLKPIDSEEVFGNVLANAGILAKEKGVHLQLNVPQIPHEKWVPVMADASRLEQVLFNIISNAIKFTPVGGTVTLTMNTISVEDGVVRDRYVIADTGIGMSAEFLPHMFDAFAQENRNETGRDQGTGLGMSIVKQLVELMGGEIHVKSELNKGTEITLLMQYPICTEVDRAVKVSADLSVLAGKHVLLCEDHPVNAQIAVKMLQKQGVLADVAENGQLGVEKFNASAEGYYAGVLMDIRMPVMTGLEAAKAIRALPRKDAAAVPIIAMTANAFDEDVQNCYEAGMNNHLTKPIDATKLYSVLAKYIGEYTANAATQA